MRWPHIILGLALLGFVMVSCAPSEPSPIEILETLETMANEKDLKGTMALFAKDAVVEESFRNIVFDGTEEIERLWKGYYDYLTVPSEFRDIAVDGDTATFRWAEVYTKNTNLWPVILEVQNGKITYMDFYENLTTVPTGEE